MRLDLGGLGLPFGGTATSVLAQLLDSLQKESDGMVLHGLTAKALVRDSSTPANNFNGDINDLLTYTSPSTKYVRNSSGVLVPGTTLRTDHDADGNALGLLIEEQRTNLFEDSEDFSADSWTIFFTDSFTITTDQSEGPDGNTTLDKLAITDTTDEHHSMQFGYTGYSADDDLCISAFMRADEQQYVGINVSTSAEDHFTAVFDLDAGTVVADDTGTASGTITDYDVIPFGNGLYRVWVSGKINETATAQVLITTYNSATPTFDNRGRESYVGTPGDAFYAGFVQIEEGTFPTSYIKTEGSTVTRAADAISLATSKFPWSALNGLLVARARPIVANALGGIVSVNDGSGDEEIVLYRDASGNLVYQVEDGGVDQLDPLDSAVNASDDTVFQIAAKYKAADFILSADGEAAQTDGAGTLPTVDTLELGVDQANNYFNGHLEWVKYVPRDVSSANVVVSSGG